MSHEFSRGQRPRPEVALTGHGRSPRARGVTCGRVADPRRVGPPGRKGTRLPPPPRTSPEVTSEPKGNFATSEVDGTLRVPPSPQGGGVGMEDTLSSSPRETSEVGLRTDTRSISDTYGEFGSTSEVRNPRTSEPRAVMARPPRRRRGAPRRFRATARRGGSLSRPRRGPRWSWCRGRGARFFPTRGRRRACLGCSGRR
jgi:hypothetical protein